MSNPVASESQNSQNSQNEDDRLVANKINMLMNEIINWAGITNDSARAISEMFPGDDPVHQKVRALVLQIVLGATAIEKDALWIAMYRSGVAKVGRPADANPDRPADPEVAEATPPDETE